jgi:hypothetical protein
MPRMQGNPERIAGTKSHGRVQEENLREYSGKEGTRRIDREK